MKKKDIMEKNSLIYVAEHNGMVSSAIVRNLNSKGLNNLLFESSFELDLTNQIQVKNFLNQIPLAMFS